MLVKNGISNERQCFSVHNFRSLYQCKYQHVDKKSTSEGFNITLKLKNNNSLIMTMCLYAASFDLLYGLNFYSSLSAPYGHNGVETEASSAATFSVSNKTKEGISSQILLVVLFF